MPENLSIGNRLLALPTNRPGRYLRYSILDNQQTDFFAIGSLGEIILQKPLDYEKASKHTFNVMVTDGSANATTQVNIDVMDVNDWEPRFRQNHYDFVVPMQTPTETNEPIPLGKLEAADGDKNDRVNIIIRGAHSHYFYIDAEGMLWLKRHLPNNATLMHLIATATDTGMPPRSSSVPVTITMEGIALAQHQWTPGVLGAFACILGLFIIVIVGMSVYIYKQKKPKAKNRVHSQDHSIASASNLVNHEKVNGNHLHSPNIRLANPLNNNHGGSNSSLSAGASTILAASLEREAKRQREREKENYTATVRSKFFFWGFLLKKSK